MKSILAITLLIFFSYHSTAADKTHFITLSGQKKTIQNHGFNLVKVINATGNDSLIGFVQKTIGYKAVPAYFENNIDVEIEAFLAQNLKESDGDNSLIVRVNSIQISETYNGINETAIAKVNLSFIFQENKKYFEIFTTGKVSVQSSAAGITKTQADNIAEAIAKCFDSFHERAMAGKLKSIEIEEEDLYIKPGIDQEMLDAYLMADRSTKGIYYSFIDFRENTPDTEKQFDVEYKSKDDKDEKRTIKNARITDIKTGKKIDDIWGFTDGRAVYTRVANRYYPLHKDEKGYFLELKVQDQSTMTAAGVAGGLIGSAIASASAPIKQVRLNYHNGSLNFSEQAGGLTNEDDAFAISFFSSSFNSELTALELFINGELKCILKSDSWYKHKLLRPAETIQVVVKSTNGMESEVNITTKTANSDIYLIIDKKKKPPVINRVYANDMERRKAQMTRENRIYQIQPN